jgi:hypothetical protein
MFAVKKPPSLRLRAERERKQSQSSVVVCREENKKPRLCCRARVQTDAESVF